jgi:hypothetical protein
MDKPKGLLNMFGVPALQGAQHMFSLPAGNLGTD